jgi:hypothetical protein
MSFPSVREGVAELPAPHIPDRVTVRFAKLHAAWTILLANYLKNDAAQRALLATYVADVTPDVGSMSPIRKAEFDKARDFGAGWQQNTRAGWKSIIDKHPFDELTPISQHERRQIALLEASIQFPQEWSRSLCAVLQEMVTLSDPVVRFSERESADHVMRELDRQMEKYKNSIRDFAPSGRFPSR